MTRRELRLVKADAARGEPGPSWRTHVLELLRLLVFPLKAVYGLVFAFTIPVGTEGDRSLRRHPWVFYAVVLLCFAGFQYQELAEPGDEWKEADRQSAERLVSFLEENPCLEAPRDITDLRWTPEWQAFHDGRARACAQAPSGPDWEKRPELGRLVAELRSVERTHPVWRFYARPVDGSPLTLVAAVFLHAGWLHLLGNLLFLYVVGPLVEDVYGRPWFAALYLLSGAVGGLAQFACDLQDTHFALGASGAISGVMGAFLVRFTTRRIRLFSLPALWFPFLRVRFSLPAYVFLVFWFGKQLAGVWSGGTGIGWWAHIGGFLFGVAFAVVFKWQRIEERLVNPAVERQIALRAHPALEAAVNLRVRGRYGAARRAVRAALEADPDNLDAWRERYEIALVEGQTQEAVAHATGLIGLYARAGEARLASRLTEEVLHLDGVDLPARFYLTAGARMESVGESALARLLYEYLRNRRPHDPAVPVGLLREARLSERQGRPEEALECYENARAHPACAVPLRNGDSGQLCTCPPRSTPEWSVPRAERGHCCVLRRPGGVRRLLGVQPESMADPRDP